jgi:hypothetical protein
MTCTLDKIDQRKRMKAGKEILMQLLEHYLEIVT